MDIKRYGTYVLVAIGAVVVVHFLWKKFAK